MMRKAKARLVPKPSLAVLGLAALAGVCLAVESIRARAAAAFLAPAAQAESETGYDVLIKNGRIMDGTANPWYAGDVAIRGDRIVQVGRLEGATAKRVIDARGLVVAPGFIDMLGQSEFDLLIDNRALSKLSQGITTEITGEGDSIAPQNDRSLARLRPFLEHYHLVVDWTRLDGYFTRLEKTGTPLNLGTYVGAAQLREAVIGNADRRGKDQRRSGLGSGRGGGYVPLSCGRDFARFLPSALGRRGRRRKAARAAHRPAHPPAHPDRDGVRASRVGKPVPWQRRRLGRDDRLSQARRAQQVRRQDHCRARPRQSEAASRSPVRLHPRRPRADRRALLLGGRAGPRVRSQAALDEHRARLRRDLARRAALRAPRAPARLGSHAAIPWALRARPPPAAARRSRPQNHLAPRRPRAPARPRPAPAGLLRGCHRL